MVLIPCLAYRCTFKSSTVGHMNMVVHHLSLK